MRHYTSDEEAQKIYKGLDDLTLWVIENLEKSPKANVDPKIDRSRQHF